MTAFLSATLRKHNCPPAVESAGDSNTRGIWVVVITGSGKHSGSGPVLRNAVKATLDKRCMTYELSPHGRGSFLVRVDSGFELHPPSKLCLDSKVLILPEENFTATNLLHHTVRQNRATGHQITMPGNVDCRNDPLPREVLVDDETLSRAKVLSANHAVHSKNDQAEREFDEQLDQAFALSLSLRHPTSFLPDEEGKSENNDFELAVVESINAQKLEQEKEEAEIKRVMQLSILQEEEDTHRRLEENVVMAEEDENDDELQKVLDISSTQVYMSDEELLHLAFEESRKAMAFLDKGKENIT